VYVTRTLARRYHLTLNGPVSLLLNDRRHTLTVVGILDDTTDRVTDRQLMLMDIGPYQHLTGQTGLVDRLHVVANAPASRLKQAMQPVLSALSQPLQANPPQRRAERAQQLVLAFQQNLQALGFVALLVGLFLVYNTMTIFVVQRHMMLATLRALGLSQRLTATLILSEATLLGLAGSVAGLLLGWGLSQASLGGVSTTMQLVYAGQAVNHVALGWGNSLGVIALGSLLTVVASVPACLQAIAIPPADTLRPGRQGISGVNSPWPRRLFWVGLALCASAAGLAMLPPVGVGFPLFGYLATFALFLGLAACLPLVVSHGLTLVLRHLAFQLPVMLAVGLGQCQRAWAKTSVAMASLMVGIALMLSMAVLIGSFRQSVIDWVQDTLRADVLIEPRIRSARKGVGSLSLTTVQAIRQLPQVDDLDPFIQLETPVNTRQSVFVATGNLPLLQRRGHLNVLQGQPHHAAMGQLSQHKPDATAQPVPVMVSEPFAVKSRLCVGQIFRLPAIAQPLQIISIYRDFASEQGYVILPSRVFHQHFKPGYVTSLAVYLKPGVSADAFRQAMARQIKGLWAGLQVRTNQQLRRDVLVIFDNTFAVTYALFAIALVVSALCVLITLLTLVIEGKTDLTLLRFLGATRGHVTQLVLTQAAVLALVGYGFGVVAGLGLSAILVFVINQQSFGWSVDFIPPSAAFLLLTGLGMLALALLAGYFPARWIQKHLQPDVLRYV
jgi:putative ABC transport system permease protein